MANVQHPGFLPLGPAQGGGTPNIVRKRALSNNTTAVFKGDAVVHDSSGGTIVASAANTAVASVAMGASYVSNGERIERHYLPATTTYSGSTVDPQNASYIYIIEDAETVKFVGSIDGAMTQTNLQNNFAMILGTGDTVTGYSRHELDSTSANTTATLPWRVTDFIFKPGNDVDSADAHVECRINAGFSPLTNTTGT